MNIQKIVDSVPDYQSFLTVDELDESAFKLADEFPEEVEIFVAGYSRNNHPIQCLKIGNGSRNALCFALPHPNEPIGAMTMEYFSRVLAENKELREELDYTWYIIKCIDPDGTLLNEAWFKGPFNIYQYTKNFYRPVGYEQVEWTFPIDYKNMHFNEPLPETKALMDIIDRISPDFMYSLHNAGFGGAYWYISHDIPKLYDGLRQSAIKQQVSLSLGEPEAPFIKEFSPAVFQTMGAAQHYDYLEKFTGEPPSFNSGTSSADYALAKNPDCVTLLTELPYFFDARIEDMTETEVTRKEAIYQNIEINKAYYGLIKELMEMIPKISEDNSFIKLVKQIADGLEEGTNAKQKWAESEPEFEQPAKVSHLFDNLQTAKFYNGLSLGLTVRAIDFEINRLLAAETQDEGGLKQLKEAKKRGEEELKKACEQLEQELDYSVIPIQKLVRIQVESGLLVSSYITKQTLPQV
ncbi:M14 family zinc carboxypeptidase [Niallia sp. FSL W8-0635]|uniref:M14 family zinc carboxypeptidase n=1 Tax=Niallia sp. FSL W8-0635 TaxID=2975337 RepID=UPI0030F65409